jgi:hypothetical protein
MASDDQDDLESISNQLREICIRNDDTVQQLASAHVTEHIDVYQAGALFHPSQFRTHFMATMVYLCY